MKKFFLMAMATALLSTGMAVGQVVVNVAPPAPIVEVRPVPPGPRYVWIAGYYRWDGRRYLWVPGRWVAPPRPRAVWIPGHWVAQRHGWVWVPGYWRY